MQSVPTTPVKKLSGLHQRCSTERAAARGVGAGGRHVCRYGRRACPGFSTHDVQTMALRGSWAGGGVGEEQMTSVACRRWNGERLQPTAGRQRARNYDVDMSAEA